MIVISSSLPHSLLFSPNPSTWVLDPSFPLFVILALSYCVILLPFAVLEEFLITQKANLTRISYLFHCLSSPSPSITHDYKKIPTTYNFSIETFAYLQLVNLINLQYLCSQSNELLFHIALVTSVLPDSLFTLLFYLNFLPLPFVLKLYL